jgi:NAD(P)H-dependent FMN reductase
MNLMNHFGSSVFSFKPSGIVSYSAGQWGGTRAAHSLRPFLSELGCLPVSAMVHIPKASQVIDENGCLLSEGVKEQEWDQYVSRMVSQVEWWAEASKDQWAKVDPFRMSPPYRISPSERNAPI